jgi:hypothetical protein
VPTARELLEQADALMRRHRESAQDDIPVLTDAVPSVQEVRLQGARPLRPVETVASAVDDSDDVPVLNDKVEEVELAAIEVAAVDAVDEGEPSVWLDFQESEPSVIGDAPDSIAIVPPVDLANRPPAIEFDDTDELDKLDDELAAAVAAAPREDESLQPSDTAEPISEMPFVPSPDASPPVPTLIAGGAAALLHGVAAAPPVATTPVVTAPTPVDSAPPPSPPTVPDAAHWEAMAEEIREQVLQRIDLFTDTGLRTQLGARLQPIVDRASADLVATINQHVGELLRAYVAEAIEREIDSWRRDH